MMNKEEQIESVLIGKNEKSAAESSCYGRLPVSDSDCASSMKKQPAQKNQAKSLKQFYKNKNILITGFTGFIGKVLLLKIMHSLSSCGQVYVLVRPKKGMSVQQRFDKLLSQEPFAPAPGTEHPTSPPPGVEISPELKYITRQELAAIDWSKVMPVEGDMRHADLGLDPQIKEKLCATVNIVFNVAACVKFDAPLKENLKDNYYGTRNLLELATKFNNLISLVHVSTFYANSHLTHIEEKVLPMERDCEKTAEFISMFPDSVMRDVEQQLLEQRQNSYVFTKAMAENLVAKYGASLPIAIVRPSMTIPSYREPYPGWVDNINGPMAPVILGSVGIARQIDLDPEAVADFIPVDIVVNSLLAVAERTQRLHADGVEVYNCSSGLLNPLRWGRMIEISFKQLYVCPPLKIARIPGSFDGRPNKLQLMRAKISELLFAYFVDLLLIIFRRKPVLIKITKRWHDAHKLLRHFCRTTYTCTNDNLEAAYSELDSTDKKDFYFNIKELNWEENITNDMFGGRRLILKETTSNIPMAIKKLYAHILIENLIKYSFISFLAYKLYKFFI